MSTDSFRGVPVSPLPGISSAHLLAVVEDQARRAGNVPGGSVSRYPVDALNEYLRWANQAARQLGSVVSARDVERLLLTPRHWALQGLDPVANGDLLNLVWLELDQCKRDLNELADSLRSFVARWSTAEAGRLLVADTNFYLHHERLFEEIPWREIGLVGRNERVTLVVPLIVIDELDRAKSNEVRTRARLTLKVLHKVFSDPSASVPLADPDTQARLLVDPPGHLRLADADSEIVDQALTLAALSKLSTSVVTYDVGMSLRTKAAGLDVKWFQRPMAPAKQP